MASQVGVRLGVENVWNRFLLSPLEMCDFIDSFQSPWVGAYFDVANVMLYGHPEHWIELLGRRILAMHMKDFRVAVGNMDGFVDLLDGDVDFAAVMAACAAIGFAGPFVAEILPGRPGSVEKAAAALRVIEAGLRCKGTDSGFKRGPCVVATQRQDPKIGASNFSAVAGDQAREPRFWAPYLVEKCGPAVGAERPLALVVRRSRRSKARVQILAPSMA